MKHRQTISATHNGVTYKKRVFFGQRALLISFSVADNEPLVTAHRDERAAEAQAANVINSQVIAKNWRDHTVLAATPTGE